MIDRNNAIRKKFSICFITNSMNRSGAPYSLLYFLEWLNKSSSDTYKIDVISLLPGALEDRFDSVSDTFVNLQHYRRESLLSRGLNRFYSLTDRNNKLIDNVDRLLLKCGRKNHNLLYANTILSLKTALKIKKYSKDRVLLVLHLHEMSYTIHSYDPDIYALFKDVDMIICASQAVKKELLANLDVEEERIRVVYEISDVKKQAAFAFKKSSKFIVGGSGLYQWRKGPDLFVQTAKIVKQLRPNLDIEFRWVGKLWREPEAAIRHELGKLNLSDLVEFTGEVSEVNKEFNNFDIFLMTSREDPFPLACIEVGLLGKPIICFEGATGTQEVLLPSGGFAVPYANAQEMAEKVIFYAENPDVRITHGEANRKTFSQFTPNKIGPQIISIFDEMINNRTGK